jgi:hypothetical protein
MRGRNARWESAATDRYQSPKHTSLNGIVSHCSLSTSRMAISRFEGTILIPFGLTQLSDFKDLKYRCGLAWA